MSLSPTLSLIRLILIDDHVVLRAGLANVLSFEPGMRVVAEGDDGAAAIALWRKHQPDVKLLDLCMPHPSPDGKWIVFLSFDKTVKGHPANQNVTLRLMPLAGGKPKVIATLFGGQGSINVPSWSPDSTQIAFVSYRHVLP